MKSPKYRLGESFETYEYEAFATSPLQPESRTKASVKGLEASLKAGIITSIWITAYYDHRGILTLADGHRRRVALKNLGLPLRVQIVTEEEGLRIADMNRNQKPWKLQDYADSQSQSGNPDYRKLNDLFAFGFTLSHAGSLLTGHSPGSNNVQPKIRNGTFKAVDSPLAGRMVALMTRLKAHAPLVMRETSVAAIGAMILVPVFDDNQFADRVEANPTRVTRFPDRRAALDTYEELYNYRSRGAPIPIRMLAEEALKARNVCLRSRKVDRK